MPLNFASVCCCVWLLFVVVVPSVCCFVFSTVCCYFWLLVAVCRYLSFCVFLEAVCCCFWPCAATSGRVLLLLASCFPIFFHASFRLPYPATLVCLSLSLSLPLSLHLSLSILIPFLPSSVPATLPSLSCLCPSVRLSPCPSVSPSLCLCHRTVCRNICTVTVLL